MKHLITLTIFGIVTTLTACESMTNKDGIDNVFTHETNLDDGQQSIVDDIETTFAHAADELLEPEKNSDKNRKRNDSSSEMEQKQRGPHGIFHRGFSVEWMIDYLEGNLDTAGVLALIQDRQEEISDHIEDRSESLLDLLASFSEEQSEQFLDNLDQRQAHIEQRQAEMKNDDRPGIDGIFSDVDLTEDQQSQLDSLLEDMGENRISRSEEKRALIEAFLSEEITREEVIDQLEISLEERHQNQIDKVRDWIDFLDNLTTEQQFTLVSILEEVQARKEERCNQMEEDLGDSSE